MRKMNLRFFGGRGASSGLATGNSKIAGFAIDMRGTTVNYVVRNGKVYRASDYEEISLSADQIISNARNVGYGVETYTPAQMRQREEAHKEYRKEMDAFLNQMDAQLGGNRSYQRKVTTSRRASRRRRS